MDIISLGIKENLSDYLKAKVKMTNQVALMCAFIGFFYSFFIYAYYPAIVVYPVMLFFISCGLLLLNDLGFMELARFLCSFQMLTLATLFHASIIQKDEPFLISFFCSQLAMTIIPWLLYDFREKYTLLASLAVCFFLLFSQSWLNEKIEVPVDVTFFRESYLNPLTYAFAVAIGIACLTALKLEKREEKVAVYG